jgi:hypothetical protein
MAAKLKRALAAFHPPTVHATVAGFAVFSGIHYIFHVAKLMKEDHSENQQ